MYNDQTAPIQLSLEDADLLEEAKDVLARLPSKITNDDLIWENPLYVQVAQLYVSTYQGTFDYMLKLRNDAAIYGFNRWSAGKYRGALNCLRAEALREARASAPTPVVEQAPGRDVPCGTYTASFPDGSHVTLRVKRHWEDDKAKAGEKIVQYLSGQDNESSYTGFAFLRGGCLQVWRKFEGKLERQLEAWKVIAGDPAKAGEAYALESSNCFRCNRKLTVPVSIHRGLGPECFAKWGA